MIGNGTFKLEPEVERTEEARSSPLTGYVPSNYSGASLVESGLGGGVGGVLPYYNANGITLFCADCRQILPFLPTFDLLLTDPPYGIGADSHQGQAKNGWKRDYALDATDPKTVERAGCGDSLNSGATAFAAHLRRDGLPWV